MYCVGSLKQILKFCNNILKNYNNFFIIKYFKQEYTIERVKIIVIFYKITDVRFLLENYLLNMLFIDTLIVLLKI